MTSFSGILNGGEWPQSDPDRPYGASRGYGMYSPTQGQVTRRGRQWIFTVKRYGMKFVYLFSPVLSPGQQPRKGPAQLFLRPAEKRVRLYQRGVLIGDYPANLPAEH